MKKFKNNEILNNTIKVYPKVKIFSFSGKFYYNNNKQSGPHLNDFLLGISDIGGSLIPAEALFVESEEPLLTEDGDFIIIE